MPLRRVQKRKIKPEDPVENINMPFLNIYANRFRFPLQPSKKQKHAKRTKDCIGKRKNPSKLRSQQTAFLLLVMSREKQKESTTDHLVLDLLWETIP